MAQVPTVRFARASGSQIAYMTWGDGPVTICAVPPMAHNIEMAWDSPVMRRMLEGYGSFSRMVAFDKRGTGMSDRSLDIPALDERVDELLAVMDAAGIEHAYLHGLSEGGPMAIMFAATYPDRVDGLILEATGATLLTDEQRERLSDPEVRAEIVHRWRRFADVWGTPDSETLALFSPSLAADPEFAAWWPRYERNAATGDALMALFEMNGEMDARGVLHRVECPVLILHRTDDPIIPVERARDTYELLDAAGADVRLMEFEGVDHYTFGGDPEPLLRATERFTTGVVGERPMIRPQRVEIRTLGAFAVLVDGRAVPTSEWGSKRARTLLKRLVAARGWPVTRDELIEVLWPGETSDRLGARLSVQLSAVRRVLHGAVVADRSSVRLDVDAVDVDVVRWLELEDDAEIVGGYPGAFLPDDVFDDWATPLRDELQSRFVQSARRRGERARLDGDVGAEEGLLRRLIEVDGYDEVAHRRLVALLHEAGRLGEARGAFESYAAALSELGVEAADYDDLARSGMTS